MEITKIYNEDCLVTMKKMPDNFVDLVLTCLLKKQSLFKRSTLCRYLFCLLQPKLQRLLFLKSEIIL